MSLQTVKSLPDVTDRYVCLLRLYTVATKDMSVPGVDFMIAEALKLFGNHMCHLLHYSGTLHCIYTVYSYPSCDCDNKE